MPRRLALMMLLLVGRAERRIGRRLGRASRSGRSFRSVPAAQPTSSRASCSMRFRHSSASRSWSRTGSAPAAPSPPAQSPRPIPTAIRCSRPRPPTPSLLPSTRTCPTIAAADFAAVIPFGSLPNVLVISPAKGFKTIQEMVAAAKAKPGIVQLRFGRRRLGHPSERRAAAPERRLRGGARAVPRRAGGADRGAWPDGSSSTSARSIPRCPTSATAGCSALVVNSPKRAVELPDVPTTLEAGYRDADLPIWIGMFAPAKIAARASSTSSTPKPPRPCRCLPPGTGSRKPGSSRMIISPAEFDAAGQAGDRDQRRAGTRRPGSSRTDETASPSQGRLLRWKNSCRSRTRRSACGLLMRNEEPIKSSTKSISEPAR